MKMFRTLAAAAIGVVAMANTASAQVTFSTTGQFSGGGCSGTTLVCIIAGYTLSFAGVPSTTVATPTNISFGELKTVGTGDPANFSGVTFSVIVSQTSPSSGNQTVTGTISGQLTATSSGLFWLPAPTSFTLGTNPNSATYTFQSPPQGYAIVPPNVNAGVTSLQGTVTTAPEPSTYALMAAGLAAMGLVARRRRQTIA